MSGFEREELEEREGLEGETGVDRAPFMPELMRKADLPLEVEDLSRRIIGCAIEVHRNLGPGLLESVYETALAYELDRAGISVQRQVEIVIPYKSIEIRGQRLDLLVGGLIVVELKAVQALHEVHTAQVLSYIRAADKPLGLLFNFNVPRLADSIRRVFNDRWSGLNNPPRPPSSPSRSSSPSR